MSYLILLRSQMNALRKCTFLVMFGSRIYLSDESGNMSVNLSIFLIRKHWFLQADVPSHEVVYGFIRTFNFERSLDTLSGFDFPLSTSDYIGHNHRCHDVYFHFTDCCIYITKNVHSDFCFHTSHYGRH